MAQKSTRKKHGICHSSKVVNWLFAMLLLYSISSTLIVLSLLRSEQAAFPFHMNGDLGANTSTTDSKTTRTRSDIGNTSNISSIDLNDPKVQHPQNKTNIAAQSIASYGSLGIVKCPWMTIPKSSRYPRKSVEVQPQQGSTSKFYNCLRALNDSWGKNNIRYTPIGGFLLSAIARGQFHGHSNDMDLDNMIAGQIEKAGCKGVHLGNWGTKKMKIVPNQTFLPEMGIFQGDIPLCECELWDLPIPCLSNTVEYLEWDYGPSWWFPVPSSKGTGWRIVDRVVALRPRSGGSWKNFDKKVFEMLKGVDKDGDMSISMTEFATTVMGNGDLNLNWLKYQVKNNPCMMIDNARHHFNGMLGFFDKHLSGNIEGARKFLGDPFDAFVGYNDERAKFVNTFPYKYLPRHMYNLEESDGCAKAVEEVFKKLFKD